MLNTPIAELGFFKRGQWVRPSWECGPIVDVQYGDFLFLAMDQIVNNAAKAALHVRWHDQGSTRHGAWSEPPAAAHRCCMLRAWKRYFTGVPGIKVAAGKLDRLHDAKGILKSAVRDDNQVLIFEHKLLYGSKRLHAPSSGAARRHQRDSSRRLGIVPLGRAVIRRQGSHRDHPSAWLLMQRSFCSPGRRRARHPRNRRRGDRRP